MSDFIKLQTVQGRVILRSKAFISGLDEDRDSDDRCWLTMGNLIQDQDHIDHPFSFVEAMIVGASSVETGGGQGAGESGQTPGMEDGITEHPTETPEPAPATPTEPGRMTWTGGSFETVDGSVPTTTDIPLHSRITATSHGECVLQPETGPRGERVVFVRPGTEVHFRPPEGLKLHESGSPPVFDWSDGEWIGNDPVAFDDEGDSDTFHLWTSDPNVDVNRHKDAKYADPCVLHVRVVPDGEEMPDFSDPYLGNVVWDANNVDNQSPLHSAHAKPDPAFFDPAKILAFVNADPEAQRQVRVIGSYGNDTLHFRRHQEARQGTGLAGLCFNPEAELPGKRFTDGNHGWDALGDALLVLPLRDQLSARINANEDTTNILGILRSKLTENPLCQTPFGIVGKSWDKPSPFRHWYGRAAYRSFVDVLDLALAYKLLQDAGLVSAVVSPQDEAHVRENFRRFAAFVEADMKVSAPRMWRSANVLAVECLRHLFPSLELPDLSGFLTRWNWNVESLANSVLTPEDPPRWLDKGDYTAGNMMGVCYSVWAWITNPSVGSHVTRALSIWTGFKELHGQSPAWMWAKKTGTPQAGQDHRCARFQNSLTQLWFPMDLSDPRDPTRTTERVLGEQDHALYVVAGSRSNG